MELHDQLQEIIDNYKKSSAYGQVYQLDQNEVNVIKLAQQQVKNCDLADVGERNAEKIWGIMADPSINKKTYDRLAEVYNDICDPINKGNLPIRIDINYV